MDIGAEFDDEFFEKPKPKQITRPENYELKVYSPLWFMDPALIGQDASEVLLTVKHQADYHYLKKNYSKAVELYEKCLKLVPENNNTWKREFMENLARSLLHIGDADKALEWSLKLHQISISPDQKVMSTNLIAAVCHALGKYEEELEALHDCVEAHQSCPELWHRLGLCYAGMFHINLPEYPNLRTVDDASAIEACCVFKSKMYHSKLKEHVSCNSSPSTHLVTSTSENKPHSTQNQQSPTSSGDVSNSTSIEVEDNKCHTCRLGTFMASSCFIRTRTLMDSGGQNLLFKDRDESIKEKIAKSLKHMEIDQSFIDIASQSLGIDFLPGLKKPDNHPDECSTSPLKLKSTKGNQESHIDS